MELGSFLVDPLVLVVQTLIDFGAAIPVLPSSGAFPEGRRKPEFLELGLQEINAGQRGIDGLQLVEPDCLFILQFLPIAQQQPAAAFDHLTARRLLAQGGGLVDMDAIHHFPAEAGGDMEEVIDDLGVQAGLPHLQVEAGVHVHGDRLDLPTAVLAQQFEDWSDSRPPYRTGIPGF